jgi:hypothetical protein
MSTASGAMRTGFERPLWHDAELTRLLPSKKVPLMRSTIFIISRAVRLVSLSSRSLAPCT